MICGSCEDEWLKFDLTIPYPVPPRPFDYNRIPQGARIFCLRPPDVTPPPPDPMEIERYLTPPAQQPSSRTSQPGTDQPLFLPENDSASSSYDLRSFNVSLNHRVCPQPAKPKIKNLDPYQEGPSAPFRLQARSSIDADINRFLLIPPVQPLPVDILLIRGIHLLLSPGLFLHL